MTVQQITTKVALVSPAGTTIAQLNAFEVSWTQDEGASPRYIATVVVAAPATAAQYAMLRPGAGYFLSVGSDDVNLPASAPYLWKVVNRERTLDGRVRLQAVSPELDLQSYRPSTVDRSNWANQKDVRAILTNVLNKVYGAGRWARYTYDVAFGQDIGVPTYPTYQAVTNLAPNGGFEYGVTGWTGVQAAVSAVSTIRHSGTSALQISPSSTLNTSRAVTTLNLQPETTYTLSAWVAQNGVRPSTANAVAAAIRVSANVANVVQDLATSANGPNVASTWNRISLTFTMPSLADAGSVVVQLINGNTQGSSIVVWFDDIMIVEGDGRETDGTTSIAYFDGDTVDGTGGYNYAWQGPAGNSSSVRTPIVSRSPDSLTWSPDQSAWEFLQPILQTVGVNLWADQYTSDYLAGAVTPRYFWATNEFGFNLPAPGVNQAFNMFDLSQTDSWTAQFPDGTPMFADQVILHYTWTDALGDQQEAYDVYPATGQKPYYIELENTPFAGVGRAQGIYKRISARATMFEGSTWFNRGIFPGQQLAITADAAGGSVVGYVDATTHDPFRGTTQFRTKQTIAYSSKSWFAATGTWASQVGTWADEA